MKARFQSSLARLLGDTLRARLARASLWSLMASMAGQGLALGGTMLCGRILGPVEFGKLSIIRSTVLMFGVFAGAGLGIAATKYVAEHRSKDPVRAGRIMGLLFVVAFGASISAMLIALTLARPIARSLGAADLVVPLRLASLLMITNTLNGVQLGALAGFERFRTVAWVSAIDGALNLVCVVAGAWKWGLFGAVSGSVAAAVVSYAVKHVALDRVAAQEHVRFRLEHPGDDLPALWHIALPSILVGVSIQPFDWLARFAIAHRGGFTQLGIFAAVYTLAQLVVFLPTQVSGPAMSILSNLVGTGDVTSLRRLIKSTQLIVFLTAAGTALPLLFLAKPVLALFGRSFAAGGSLVLIVMVLTYVTCSPALITRAVFAATGKMWWQVWQTAVWGVLLAALAYAFAKLGAMGLALAYFVSYAIFTAIQLTTQRLAVARLAEVQS